MKHIILIIACLNLFGCTKSSRSGDAYPERLQRFSHSAFSLHAPVSWKRKESSETFSIFAPDDIAIITVTVHGKKDRSLEEFAASRFSLVESFYSQVGPERLSISHKSPSRLSREYEGTSPSESRPTYYVVTCIPISGAFVALTITTTRTELEDRREVYEAIVKSVTDA